MTNRLEGATCSALVRPNTFYATLVSGPGSGLCDTSGFNDVFGCGTASQTSGSCGALDRRVANACNVGAFSCLNDANEQQPFHEAVFLRHGSDVDGGVLCCRDDPVAPFCEADRTSPLVDGRALVPPSAGQSGPRLPVGSGLNGRSFALLRFADGFTPSTTSATLRVHLLAPDGGGGVNGDIHISDLENADDEAAWGPNSTWLLSDTVGWSTVGSPPPLGPHIQTVNAGNVPVVSGASVDAALPMALVRAARPAPQPTLVIEAAGADNVDVDVNAADRPRLFLRGVNPCIP